MNEHLQRRGRGDVVVEKDTKVEEFCWKGRGDRCAGRGRSGKQRRIMGKMRIKVTFSPPLPGTCQNLVSSVSTRVSQSFCSRKKAK